MRRDGIWFVQWRNPDATPQFLRKYFGRGPEGEAAARQYNDGLGLRPWTPRTPAPYTQTFAEIAEAYLTYKAGRLQPSSLSALWYKLKAVYLPELGRVDAAKLTHARLDAYVQRRLAVVKRTTVHREVADIMAITSWAAAHHHLTTDPLSKYPKPRRDDEVIQPPTTGEIARILRNSPPHLARALRITYYTGVRPGRSELLALTWSQVDLYERTLFVVSAKKRGPVKRVIPISDPFLEWMRRWRAEDGPEIVPLVHYHGRPVQSLKTAFARAKRMAGITRRLTPYSFRHAFATTLLNHGADLKSTSAMLGHSREDTTLRVYQHTAIDVQRAAVGKLPKI